MPDLVERLNVALEGRHRIERELGEGGTATVYLAGDLRHERKVVLFDVELRVARNVAKDAPRSTATGWLPGVAR